VRTREICADTPGGEDGRAQLFTGPVRSIRLETVITAPVGECFELSLSVDAHTASMGHSGERVVGGVTSGVMKLGDTVTWRARHFGIAFRMTAVITEFQYPSRFADEQSRGPFRRWHHEHTFAAAADHRTLMTDIVQFESPLGPLGALADRVVLSWYLTRLLRRRNIWLKSTLEARS
jgi:ligand-binding SRPBCC domain-containing protein